MPPLAPEPILRAALYVIHHAALTTRNWTLVDEWPRQQVNDLWEAIHEIPSLLTRWRKDAGQELPMYLDEYDRKWPNPRLREMFRRHMEQDARAMPPLAPEPILRAALYVVYRAAYTTRNWTLRDGSPHEQVNDLWDAIHQVPSLLTCWRTDAEKELLMHFGEYKRKWAIPNLLGNYQQHREGGVPA